MQHELTSGLENIRCPRLSDKGMLRWHTACCDTPIANTATRPGMPFVGLIRTCMQIPNNRRDDVLGPVTLFHRGRSTDCGAAGLGGFLRVKRERA